MKVNNLKLNSKRVLLKSRQVLLHYYNLKTDFNSKLLLLLYHRVLPEINFNPLDTLISLKTFLKQIEILTAKYSVISLGDAIEQSHEGKAKKKIQIVLTFDDAYKDNYEIVFPLLMKKGIPASFFLSTSYINSKKPMWDWEAINILIECKKINKIKVDEKLVCLEKKEQRLSFALRVFQEMKLVSVEQRDKILNFIRDQSGNRYLYDEQDGFMTWDQARKMNLNGMEIGSHAVSHQSLAKLPLSMAVDEIKESKKIIENNLSSPCQHFAFPFGSENDYNERLINNVRDAGYQSCLLNVPGYNHLIKNSFCFKRMVMTESTNLDYLLG